MNASGKPEPGRLANLLGALALALSDEVGAALQGAVSGRGREPAALVTLATWPGLSIEALRRVLELSQPATVHLVDRLEDQGWVRREPGRDGRTRALALTPTGRRLSEDIQLVRLATLSQALETLDPVEHDQLERLTAKVLMAVERDRDRALHVCRLCDQALCKAADECPVDLSTRRP
jgi:DNA-binding MarR family transcriptional regulator